MSLRVLALAPPQYPVDPGPSRSLQSEDPASLFNACRWAAHLAEAKQGPWADSNWAETRQARRASVLMFRSWLDAQAILCEQLEKLRPNLVLIGSMSICLPGAVRCACLVKEVLGDAALVVLGGRHPSESIYADASGQIVHHPSSPLRLMEENLIPPVFDLVVAGDGEHLIAAIGEQIAFGSRVPTRSWIDKLAGAAGRWIAGTLDERHRAVVVRGIGPPLDYNTIPPPCEMFGVRARFNVFGGCPTAHVFSDVGGSCIYDCTFCSERIVNMGPLRDLPGSADRLHRQFQSAARVIEEDYPGEGVSAFVEDSTLLAFAPRLVERLLSRMHDAPVRLRWGAQLTIDQTLFRPDLLRQLHDIGLDYLFVGVETRDPAEIGGMSKDVRRRRAGWLERVGQALETLLEAKIVGGVAILFGLGETQRSRMLLAEQLRSWRNSLGVPYPISMNWAVQHPLLGLDGGSGYRYLDWAIPAGPYLAEFRDYGEASLAYPIASLPAASLSDLREVNAAMSDLLDPPQGFESRRLD
jgi:B12-binding domain/radical SAM domain protein